MSRELPPPLNRLTPQECARRTYRAGESVFLQNSPGIGLFYIHTGMVDLRRTTESGQSILIHRARAGDTFAEAAVFSEATHCNACAAVDTVLTECFRSAIDSLVTTDPEFSQQLLRRFAHQLQTARRQVELLSIKAADQRIVAALRDGLLIEDINAFADLVALAPETVYRTLSQLTECGTVVKGGRGKYRLAESP